MHPGLTKFLTGKIELTHDQAIHVNQCFTVKNTFKNEILIEAGAVARHLYLVVKGSLRVFLTNNEGVESTRFLIFENRMGTAFPSFIQRRPSVAVLQSPEPSELLSLSFKNREMLNATVPGWETMERKMLELVYIDAIQRIESLITTDAKERYDLLLKQNPEMILRLPGKIIADYLGVSPETLSRLKKQRFLNRRSASGR